MILSLTTLAKATYAMEFFMSLTTEFLYIFLFKSFEDQLPKLLNLERCGYSDFAFSMGIPLLQASVTEGSEQLGKKFHLQVVR